MQLTEQSAAGVLNYLITSILPTLRTELPSPNAAGYDMTDSFLGAVRDFVLAQAQECFWQQAVMRELIRALYRNSRVELM